MMTLVFQQTRIKLLGLHPDGGTLAKQAVQVFFIPKGFVESRVDKL